MTNKVKFTKKASLADMGMWLLCKNISVFTPSDDIFFTEEEWANNQHPQMGVNVSLISKISKLKEETDEFDSADLEVLRNHLLETKANECKTLILDF